jgi:hypothetical protein
MRQFYRVCGLATALAVGLSAAGVPSAEQIVTGLVKRSERQDCELQGYSVIRRYTLRNHHLNGDASMTVRLVYEAGHGKQFSILHVSGSGVAQHALVGLRREEKSNEDNPSWNAVNPKNYQFTLLNEETHDGRLCHHFRIVPRQGNKLLIDGELWVDAEDLAVVAIKGRPAKSLSFWVGRPLIEQHFAPVHGFWMPSGNQTTAQVKLAGDTQLSIEYWEYKLNLPQSALRAP